MVLLFITLGCKEGQWPLHDPDTPQELPPQTAYEEVIEPQVAGQFYPDEPEALRSMIREFFIKTPDLKFADNMLGFMVPHAGYIYSGPVAAYVFKNLPKDRFKKVVIIFPCHSRRYRGVLALYQDAYRTPLGNVTIDRDTVGELIESDPVIFWEEGLYQKEHSGEVMLPFLQESLEIGLMIIPLMMGDQSPNMARRLAEILDKKFAGQDDVLFIASSDMSHYKDYETANGMDAIALNQIMHMDIDALAGDLKTGRAELCGYGPVLTIMHLSRLRGAKNAKVLKYLNSGDTQGDKRKVVGYGAVEFYEK